jgi:NAD(P)-dependent dehydrogenase (short-subunit alcohol dehydrogenase family)
MWPSPRSRRPAAGADEASVQQGFTAAEAAFGPVEVVIANAGVAGSSASALKTDVEDFMGVFEVNLRGAFLTAREGARRMMAAGSTESGRGRIILIGSIRGLHATPGSIGYSASKSALHQMGLVMAREWVGRGVNVNVLAPGYVETEMTTPWLQGDVGEAFVQAMPRRRLMGEADMDDLLLFLSSDSSRAVTGSIFKIDDGQTLV